MIEHPEFSPLPRVRVNVQFKFHTGNDTLVASSLVDRAPVLLPSFLAKLITLCVSFKTLDQHAQDAWDGLSFVGKIMTIKPLLDHYLKLKGGLLIGPGCFKKMLQAIFESFLPVGLFVTEEKFISWAKQTLLNEGAPPPKISNVGILTCDRPEQLKACLTSYLENCAHWNRTPTFSIHDDSRDVEARELNRRTAKELSAAYHQTIVYIGREEKQEVLRTLSQQGIPETVLNFALGQPQDLGVTCGGNRNSFLLQTAGTLALSVDDDTLCKTACSPYFKKGLQIESTTLPYHYASFSDREASLRFVNVKDEDFLGLHEHLLGKSLARCVVEQFDAETADVKNMSPPMLSLWAAGKGKILTTFNGLVGDSGSDCPTYFFFLEENDRKRLLQSEEAFRTALTGREITKCTDQFLIERMTSFMAGFLGVDNRDLLPPFFPYFRNEDGLFGEVLRWCAPESLMGFSPWTAVHCPPKRSPIMNLSESYEPLSPEKAIRHILELAPPHPKQEHISARIQEAGKSLMDAASLPTKEFQRLLADSLARESCNLVSTYQALLKLYPRSPAFWIREVKNLIESSRENAVRDPLLTYFELANNMEKETARQLVQKMVLQYGELLTWWPTIVDAAKKLQSQSLQVALPV